MINKSFSQISWENYQQYFNKNTLQWTLVHGDFHAGNILVDPKATIDNSIITIDWDSFGVGVGPSELAWFLITYVEPSLRRDCEARLLDDYYTSLISYGVRGYSREQLYHDYTYGCVGRAMWFVGRLADLPDSFVQFFSGQLAAFIIDHKIDSAKVGQPLP